MNTNIFSGYNASKCTFSHMGTLRLFGRGGVKRYEEFVNSMFNNIEDVNQMFFSIEKGIGNDYYHLHNQWSYSNNSNSLDSIIKYLKPHKIDTGVKDVLVKTKCADSQKFFDKINNTEYTRLISRSTVFYITPIIESVNASLYTSKHTAYGFNNGYLMK